MTKDQSQRASNASSRRTGLDRRWIHSTGYQPERRCGKDRREQRKQSFLEPIELNAKEANQPPFADIDFDPMLPTADHSRMPIAEKGPQRTPEVNGDGEGPEQK